MNKFLSIQQAAKFLGVSPQTLRRWEKSNKIAPSHRTQGGQRRYESAKLLPFDRSGKPADRPTVAYARVSSHDQKEDLQRQVNMLETYCSAKEPIPLIFFVEFLDYFGLFSIQTFGDNIQCRYGPQNLESKIGSKEPKNRLKLISGIGSGVDFFNPQRSWLGDELSETRFKATA